MNTVRVDSLKNNLSFSGDLFIDSTFLLLPKSGTVTEGLIKSLKEWDFQTVLCDGGLSLGNDITDSDITDINTEPAKRQKIGDIIKQIVEEARETSAENDEQARIEMVKKVYAEYMNYIEYIFTHYTTHKEIDQNDLAEGIQDLCIFIKDHRRYVLRVNSSPDIRDKNFLVVHSMRSTVLAIAIAQQLHLPLSKMIELGITCLIHEIGMLQLPPQLYMKTKRLTPGERMQISKHTIFGYKIVKDLNFPTEVQAGVFEHHEKENGTGYPRQLTGDKINRNAKIISVACSYEAISSPRSYRDERSTFDALIEMIQNEDNQYDNRVLKALLYTVSLYPIGTYVFLSNRKVAVVIDSNPENPKAPIIQSLTEREPDGTLKTFKAGDDGITILRILSKEEKKDIIPALKEKIKQEEEEIHAQQLKQQEENKQKAIEAGIIESDKNHNTGTANEEHVENKEEIPNDKTDENKQEEFPINQDNHNDYDDSKNLTNSDNLASSTPVHDMNPDGTENIDINIFS